MNHVAQGRRRDCLLQQRVGHRAGLHQHHHLPASRLDHGSSFEPLKPRAGEWGWTQHGSVRGVVAGAVPGACAPSVLALEHRVHARASSSHHVVFAVLFLSCLFLSFRALSSPVRAFPSAPFHDQDIEVSAETSGVPKDLLGDLEVAAEEVGCYTDVVVDG